MIFKVAILAILRNKTRALLTCLGIIVGIAAVIAVLAIGKGASTMMLNEISSMGNNLMMVFPDRNRQGAVRTGMGSGQTMTAGDAEAIRKELGYLVKYVSPAVNRKSLPLRTVNCQNISLQIFNDPGSHLRRYTLFTIHAFPNHTTSDSYSSLMSACSF